MESAGILFLLYFIVFSLSIYPRAQRFNKVDINSLLHRLNKQPGNLKWNLFSPNQDGQNGKGFVKDQRYPNTGISPKESQADDLYRRPLRQTNQATSLDVDKTHADASGSAEITMEGQTEVPNHMLITMLQILSAGERPGAHNDLSTVNERKGNTYIDRMDVSRFAGLSGNLNKLEQKQNGVKLKGRNVIPNREALITGIQRLLDNSKQRRNKASIGQTVDSKTSGIIIDVNQMHKSRVRNFERMRPMMLEPLEIGPAKVTSVKHAMLYAYPMVFL